MMRPWDICRASTPDWPALALRAADALRSAGAERADVGIVLGSGLGPLADEIEASCVSCLRRPARDERQHRAGSRRSRGRRAAGRARRDRVPGATARLRGARRSRLRLPGPRHARPRCALLLVSNACGGLDPTLRAGDLLLQLDLINMTGDQALVGPTTAWASASR
jgi:purine-nucleoside phosphorylase